MFTKSKQAHRGLHLLHPNDANEAPVLSQPTVHVPEVTFFFLLFFLHSSCVKTIPDSMPPSSHLYELCSSLLPGTVTCPWMFFVRSYLFSVCVVRSCSTTNPTVERPLPYNPSLTILPRLPHIASAYWFSCSSDVYISKCIHPSRS